ncbi:MAG: hypothetical protein P1U32_08740 [Legionellaceae bacterium]|nr:hypothetical protein [Legionellaceae bacterium]
MVENHLKILKTHRDTAEENMPLLKAELQALSARLNGVATLNQIKLHIITALESEVKTLADIQARCEARCDDNNMAHDERQVMQAHIKALQKRIEINSRNICLEKLKLEPIQSELAFMRKVETSLQQKIDGAAADISLGTKEQPAIRDKQSTMKEALHSIRPDDTTSAQQIPKR